MRRPLTEKERRVLRYIAAGFAAKEIAFELGVSLYTIKTQTVHLRVKLGAKNSAHAVALAFRKEILKW